MVNECQSKHFTLSYNRKGLIPIGKYKLQYAGLTTTIEKEIKSLMDLEDDIDTLIDILKFHKIIIMDKFTYNHKIYFPDTTNVEVVRLQENGYIIISEQNDYLHHLRHIVTSSNIPYVNTTEHIYTSIMSNEVIFQINVIDTVHEITIYLSGFY